MKPNKIIILLSLVVIVLSFSACSNTVSNESQSTASSKSQSKDIPKIVPAKLSDDPYSYDVSINGTAYTFPVLYSVFEQNNWACKDLGTDTLQPAGIAEKTLTNGKQNIEVKLFNSGDTNLQLSECYVAGVTIDATSKENGTTMSISKDITLGSTYEEVIKAYGKASNEGKTQSINKLTYTSDFYSYYEISIDTKINQVVSIMMENLVAPKKSSTDETIPEVVRNYKSPSVLGNDLLAFNVKYDGILYKLPAPISEFAKNGWVLLSDGKELVHGGGSGPIIKLKKGKQVIVAQSSNYSNNKEFLKNCFITDLEYSRKDTAIHLELPKGISEKSTIEEVIAAYGKPASEDEEIGLKYYSYGGLDQAVSFTTKDGKIQEISVMSSPHSLK
jgi:hypothetical protein